MHNNHIKQTPQTAGVAEVLAKAVLLRFRIGRQRHVPRMKKCQWECERQRDEEDRQCERDQRERQQGQECMWDGECREREDEEHHRKEDEWERHGVMATGTEIHTV